MSKRDEAYEAWWKKRKKIVDPFSIGIAALATRQAWDAAWDYRDCNGPEEEDARKTPLPDDLWIKHTARGVKHLRRFIRRTPDHEEDEEVDRFSMYSIA